MNNNWIFGIWLILSIGYLIILGKTFYTLKKKKQVSLITAVLAFIVVGFISIGFLYSIISHICRLMVSS